MNAGAIKIQPKTGKKFCSTFIKTCIRRKTRSKNSKIYLQKSTILYEEMREKNTKNQNLNKNVYIISQWKQQYEPTILDCLSCESHCSKQEMEPSNSSMGFLSFSYLKPPKLQKDKALEL